MTEHKYRSNRNILAQGYTPIDKSQMLSKRIKRKRYFLILAFAFLAIISIVIIFVAPTFSNKENKVTPANMSTDDNDMGYAKPWNMTIEDWVNKYNELPTYVRNTKFEGPFSKGVVDYRHVYYGTVGSYIDIIFMCEDTTDKVCGVLLQARKPSQELEMKSFGSDLAGIMLRLVYACDSTLQFDEVVDIVEKADLFSDRTTENSFVYNTNYYIADYTATTISFGVRLNDEFASEQEFLQYRNSTFNSKSK